MPDVQCNHDDCGYEWDYSGDLQFATCPSCRRKTRVETDDSE